MRIGVFRTTVARARRLARRSPDIDATLPPQLNPSLLVIKKPLAC